MRIEDCIERQIKGLWGTDFSDIGIPVIKTNNLSYEGLIDYSDVCKRNITPEQASGNYLQFGDLLIEKSGGTKTHSVGYVSYFDAENDKYLCNNFILALRPKNDIFSKFLFYQIHYKYESGQFFDCFNKTTGIQNLKVKDYLAKEIVLPSLEEQKHIAAVLDKCTALIAKYKLMLEKYDTLIKSRFIEMFGDPVINSKNWQIKPIGDSCFVTKLAGFEYSKYIHYSDTGDVVMVKAQNVKNGKLNNKDLSYISNEVSDSLPRSQLAKNDVVMTYVGANIGDVAVIDNKYKYHLAPNVAKIRPNFTIYNSVFLVQLLMMLRNYIVGNSANTAKAAIGMEKIRLLKLPIPPIDLQNDFASFVQQIDKSKFAVQKSLEKTEILYKSLMQTYFG